jgi:hypothetical protein
MTVTALKKEKVDERAALRAAVAEAQEARAAVAKQCDAIESARGHVAEAAGDHAAAVAAVDTAQRDHAERVATAIAGGASPTATGLIRAARAHERDAQDDLAASKDALRSLEADLHDLESDLHVAGKTVDKVLAATLEPLCRNLIAETRAQYARFLATQAALSAVSSLFDPWSPVAKEAGLAGLFSDTLASQSSAVRKQWQAALAAMHFDASIDLPSIED